MSSDRSLTDKTATEIVNLLKSEEISCHDLLDALEARIGEVDGDINALPTLCFERARKSADDLMAKPVGERGVLAGLPVPIKDLSEVAGVRTTYGSPIFADFVPEVSNIVVQRLEREGGVIYAKSNTPEFGSGGNTFNEVFGPTLNPWDVTRSCAGSSGGAAAALASGTAWVAHGSDMGGSLRNPASFCGIVGLRPTPGRVARTPTRMIDDALGVQGPMARNVSDVALMLDAMTGIDAGDPMSLPKPAESFVSALHSGKKPKKVAFSRDLGITAVDPEVARICEEAAHQFERAGVIVEEATPDFQDAHEIFQTLRALNYAISFADLLKNHRDKLKPEIVWNIERGQKLTTEDIVKAQQARTKLFHRVKEFFQSYDLLLSPATIVAPFPIEHRFVEECDGHKFDNYVEWLGIAYALTIVSSPAISLPAGFTAENLPVGLQLAGPARGEAQVLKGARVLEEILGISAIVPIDPRKNN